MASEKAIARQITTWLSGQPGCFFFRATGGRGQMGGLPDIIVCWRGRFVGLEVKQPGRYPTARQRAVIAAIGRGQGVAVVVRSLDDVKAVLLGEDERQCEEN